MNSPFNLSFFSIRLETTAESQTQSTSQQPASPFQELYTAEIQPYVEEMENSQDAVQSAAYLLELHSNLDEPGNSLPALGNSIALESLESSENLVSEPLVSKWHKLSSIASFYYSHQDTNTSETATTLNTLGPKSADPFLQRGLSTESLSNTSQLRRDFIQPMLPLADSQSEKIATVAPYLDALALKHTLTEMRQTQSGIVESSMTSTQDSNVISSVAVNEQGRKGLTLEEQWNFAHINFREKEGINIVGDLHNENQKISTLTLNSQNTLIQSSSFMQKNLIEDDLLMSESDTHDAKLHSIELANKLEAKRNPAVGLKETDLKISVPPHDQKWSAAIAERIKIMSNDDIQVARVQLDPPELGQLEIRIRIQQDQVSVAFNSAHQSVRDSLDTQTGRLRELLNEQGIELKDVTVSDQRSGQNDRNMSQDEHNKAFVTDDADHEILSEPTSSNALPEGSYSAVNLVDYFA